MTPSSDPSPIILIVEDVFQIEGRGTVVTGFLRPDSELARPGVAIELRTPQGNRFTNSIADLERFLRGRLTDEPPRNLGLLLASPIASEELPRGSEVCYVGPSQVV